MTCPDCGEPLRKPRRGPIGLLAIAAFWAYNVVFLWVFVEFDQETQVSDATNDFERAGEAIGVGLGLGSLLFFWIVGAVILGLMALLTRPR